MTYRAYVVDDEITVTRGPDWYFIVVYPLLTGADPAQVLRDKGWTVLSKKVFTKPGYRIDMLDVESSRFEQIVEDVTEARASAQMLLDLGPRRGAPSSPTQWTTRRRTRRL